MTTYYTYAFKAYDRFGKTALEGAWVNITQEDIMIANLNGKMAKLTEGIDYTVVAQPKKIVSKGNKAQRWMKYVAKQTGLYTLKKADALKYSSLINGIRIKE